MAQRTITSTDDPLYIDCIAYIADAFEERTPGLNKGVMPRWIKKDSGKTYCAEGCINGRCPGHALKIWLGSISRHPEWKFFVYTDETYTNGKNRKVMYFYEDDVKSNAKYDELLQRMDK